MSGPAKNARKKRCKRGHKFDYVSPRGWRGCRACKRVQIAAFYKKNGRIPKYKQVSNANR